MFLLLFLCLLVLLCFFCCWWKKKIFFITKKISKKWRINFSKKSFSFFFSLFFSYSLFFCKGNLLESPKTEKVDCDSLTSTTGLECGACGMQGWRLEMEVKIDNPSYLLSYIYSLTLNLTHLSSNLSLNLSLTLTLSYS